MCNLYSMTKNVDAIRRLFGVDASRDRTGNLSSMPLHMADVGTDNYEQEFTLSLMANQGQALEEIGAALERIQEGTFGRCEECEAEIPSVRLERW